MGGNLQMSQIRVHNTFMTLADDNEDLGKCIYKSLSMPAFQDSLNDWYIYGLPKYEDRAKFKLSLTSRDGKNDREFLLKPTSMFSYNQKLVNFDLLHSQGCVPMDENGNLTSVGSVRHLVRDCERHFEHLDRRRLRGKNKYQLSTS